MTPTLHVSKKNLTVLANKMQTLVTGEHQEISVYFGYFYIAIA